MLKLLKRFFEPVRHQKKKSLKLMFEGFFEYLWWDLVPIVSIPLLIKYLNDYQYDAIRTLSLGLIAFYAVMWIIHFFIRKWDIEARFGYEIYLITAYLNKSILKDTTHVEKMGSGKLQSIVKSGIDSWTEANWGILYSLTRVVAGIATGIYIVFNFDIKYVPYFLLIMTLSSAAYYYFRKLKLKYDEKANDIGNDISKDYIRLIMSRQEVILAGGGGKETDNIVGLTRRQERENSISAKFDFLSDLSVSGVVTLLPIVGTLLLTNLIGLNAANIGLLISFIYFCSRFSGSIYSLVWVIRQMFDHYPKIKTFWKYLDETPDFKAYYEGQRFVHDNGDIVLDDVTFAYEDKVILERFSLHIPGGQKVAFVGKSGSGKTTIAKLITGLVSPKEGRVVIDGQDVSGIALSTLYPSIGYLTQEPMVFDGTIRANLLYSIPVVDIKSMTDGILMDVLKKAECDFVTDLDTHIGEKGIKLSGGERQRLAIAKLMLKNPEIIILDEPTSALDSFSEDAITRALDKLFEGKTVIIIAHRLQTVKKADVILVMEKGKVIERGSSDELAAQGGEYKRMLDLQSL